MERATASGLEYQPEDGAILPRGLVKDSHEKGKRRHARHLVDPQGEKEERELECWAGNKNLRETARNHRRDNVKGKFWTGSIGGAEKSDEKKNRWKK